MIKIDSDVIITYGPVEVEIIVIKSVVPLSVLGVIRLDAARINKTLQNYGMRLSTRKSLMTFSIV